MNLPGYILNAIEIDDSLIKKDFRADFTIPAYTPENHYNDLTKSPYYRGLIFLRHHIKSISDYYFGTICKARNIDLFMITPSVSSPMGPGSDSEAIEIQFGDKKTYLVDSSQFGFEPILMNDIERVYCYLPSMRGENPDNRHLNQFFHCEAEIRGTLDDLTPIVENYVRMLSKTLLAMPAILERLSLDIVSSQKALEAIVAANSFPRISFDEAIEKLAESGEDDVVQITSHGRDITAKGERILLKLIGSDLPVWVYNYDRDRVAFYQKPLPGSTVKVINADLLFPPLIEESFGGEIVGAGQRQDSTKEMYESLSRQEISAEPYEWYIKLRNSPGYSVTSGFGLGIERFITWALCRKDIKEAIVYPRLKNVLTYP